MQFEPETLPQLAFVALTLALFLAIYSLQKRTFKSLRSSNRTNLQSNRHFLAGAQLLSRAQSTRHRSSSASLAKSALSEADAALALRPKDPAAHILKALAQDLLGHRAAALRSLDVALSPPAVRMLEEKERADALVKRAEVKLEVNRRRRVDSAVEDLVEAVGLTRGSEKAYCLLGQCYELKGMRDQAQDAFKRAIEIEPESVQAREGLARLKA